MKRMLKRITVLVMVAAMVMGMSATAFAATSNTTSCTATLYKDGTYQSGSPELSMGNGAMDGASITELSNGNYAVTVNFKSSFSAYGLTGYLKTVTLPNYTNDGLNASVSSMSAGHYTYTKSGSAVTGVTLVTSSMPTLPLVIDANFTINVLIMPINAAGDIVITANS